MWLAPNVITVMGFACVLTNLATLVYFCGEQFCSAECGERLPSWAFVTFALGIWLYQTCDNIDGKQARKTGSSSALGELLDHGCDSLFMTLAGPPLITAAGALEPWFAIAVTHLGYALFYLAHWEEYHTGSLILGKYANPTEVQYVFMGVHLLAAAFGPAVWRTPLSALLPLPGPLASVPLNSSVLSLGVAVGVVLVTWNVFEVARAAAARGVSFARACLPLVPFFVHVAAGLAWLALSPSDVLHEHPLLVVFLYGLVVSYLLDRLILDRITNVTFAVYHHFVLVTPIGLVTALLASHRPGVERAVFYILFVVTLFAFCHFVHGICTQLANHLNIYIFRVGKPKAS
jgi:ethanolaminephosphotransferase